MAKIKKLITILLMVAILMTILSGCGSSTWQPSSEKAVTVTMFGYWSDQKDGDIYNNFSAAIAKKFPEIRVEYEAFPTDALSYMDELTRRMKHGEAADIIMTADTTLQDSGKLMELTDQEFVSRYRTMDMEAFSEGGDIYLLPGVGDVNSSFIMALASNYLTTPEGKQWLKDYNDGNAAMKGNAQWEEVWNGAERMVKSGYITDSGIINTENRLRTMPPLPSETSKQQIVFSDPTCYFALNGKLEKIGNEKKRKAALKILDYISTAKGQEVIRGNVPVAHSYLKDVQLQIAPEFQGIADLLKEESFAPNPVFERGVEKTLEDVFEKLLRGEVTGEQAMIACDQQNASYTAIEEAKPNSKVVLGKASGKLPWSFKTSRTKELSITDFVADSVKEATGAEMALELGTAVRGEFFSGDITNADIQSVIREDKKLYLVQVTGLQMWDLIEQGVKEYNSSWFIVVSGLRYSFKEADEKKAGKLLTLTEADGTPIDMAQTYTVAVSENQMISMDDVYSFVGLPAQDTGWMLRDAVANRIKKQKTISSGLDGRIEVEILD